MKRTSKGTNRSVFQPTFGNRPDQYIGRDGVIEQFMAGLQEPVGSRNRCTLFLGQRGMGMTAKQWREANPDSKGNIRDGASINELICLSNMENINAVLINDGVSQGERLVKLNKIAIQ